MVATAVCVLISAAAGLVGRRTPEPDKDSPYESGYPTAPFRGRIPVRFYVIAMLFVIFDVEAASFYPWAVVLGDLKRVALLEMAVFFAVLAVGYAYVWKRGGFQWR
ncbi:MAG: NADH-quinone oxidoreductase subunit A [Clostridia bacterium]|nr:NADH-quinone oxidoreductase subunit A [Clostridia bacterium]